MKKRKGLLAVSLLMGSLFLQTQFLFGKELSKIFLEEVLSVGSLDDDALFQWVGVVTDLKNYIYVTDAMDYSLKKFDTKGNLLKKTGRKGQGPGEFLAPRLLDSSDQLLYVTDQYIPGIHVFDRNLEFRHKIPLMKLVGDLKVISDKQIAVVTFSYGQIGKIFFYDDKGKVIREFDYSTKKSSLLMDSISFDIDFHGNIYLAYNFQDKIEKFDAEGRKLWSQELLRIRRVKRKKISSMVVPTKIVYKDVVLDTAGKLFVLGGNLSKNPSRDVYVLSQKGEHLTTFTLPETSHCIYIDSQDYLYSRANDGVTLKKYRMRIIYK